jgi:peptidoglycan/LPS O-acetylase OafA/YrhL
MQASKALEAAVVRSSSPSEVKPALRYRSDIDGLRAVAVMIVLAFHLDAFSVFGGFVGVDVFFVISGFLISSVILRDIEESRFSLVAFYERRIRRIIPALVVMMFVTTIACAYYQLPGQLVSTGKSLLAATFSVSNVYFLLSTNYFSNNDAKPFLPTWSLAVEEQFYIFFPLFLLLVRRFFPGRFKAAIISVAAASFVLSVFSVYAYPGATFYLPMTRAWELLLGTMLALNIFPRIESGLWRNLFAATGLAGILVCAFAYSNRVPFPGLAALAPCLGAALIIAAGETGTSAVGRILSLKPVVFIGLISYSLYLWHVPIIIFQKLSMLQFSNASNHLLKGTTVVISILVATLSWRFIETPFRKGRLMLKGGSAFGFAAASAALLTVMGLGLVASHGLPSRYTQRQLALASYIDTAFPARSGTCFMETGGSATKPYDAEDCLRQDPSRKNYLLVGDSHAAQLWYGLQQTFPDINLLQATASGCEPSMQNKDLRLLDRLDNHLFGDLCRPMMDYVFSDYLVKHHVDRVVIAARWEQEDLPRLDYTIRTLKARGIDVLLIGPIMQYDSDLPWLLVSSQRKNDPELPLRHRIARYEGLDAEMSKLARDTWNVAYVSYFDLLCRQKDCMQTVASDIPLQFDYGHLTASGSVLISQMLKAHGEFGLR